MSIYKRLFFWFCAANLITLAVSVLIAHAIFERSADRPPDIEQLASQVQAALARNESPRLDALPGGRRAVLVRDGEILDAENAPRSIQRHLDEMIEGDAELRLPRGPWLVSRRLQAAAPGVHFLVVMEARQRRPPGSRFLAPGLQILLSILAIAGVGWIVARHLSQPLQQVRGVVRRVAAGELSSRMKPEVASRADEYGELARDVDRMAAQIQTLVGSRDQLLHDVSHELRAPLSRLRFALELARDDGRPETLARADREIERIDRLVGELLALARLEQASQAQGLPPLDVRALAQEVIHAERPQAAHRNVNLVLSAGDLQANADQESLGRALENLIRNAVRHAPAGSDISISVERSGSEALVKVRDRGPGVSEDELSRLFEPFFRGASAQAAEGHGLGLAIVSRVMRAHGGRAEARNIEGGGLEMRLCWPLQAPV